MMMDYAAANAANRRFKSALTRAKNKRDYDKVIAVVAEFHAFFAARHWPLPDNWATFEVAKEDAEHTKRMAG